MKRALCLFALSGSLLIGSQASAAQTRLNGHTFTLPEGFTIELVAAPPLANRPISIAYDDQGRLYATDSGGATEKAPEQYKTKPHRIVRLTDADGDGRFDQSTVFADKFMFPEGAMFYGGSLYVAAPPEIWKLTDDNDDGVADRREVWFDGKTLTGCANDLHGPYLGPDGWFYWTKGAFAEQSYTLPGGKPFVTRASHIFRARPDATGIEPVMTGGMDNPVGLTFTPGGERIFSTTFFQQPGGGLRDGLIHAIYGGVYGKQQDALNGHIRTGELMPVLTHMGAAAPADLITYASAGFGAGYRGNLFASYFNLHKIVRHELVPNGATFQTKDTDFLVSNNPDFHPTDVLEDADGSLLIVDTGGWYKICCPTSQLWKPDVLGAIYRVRKTGAPKLADPRGLKINWARATPDELTGLLGDPRHFVQQRALHELGQRGQDAVPVLARALDGRASAGVQLNAVWALTRIDHASARLPVRSAIYHKAEEVRLAAIHSASLWRDPGALTALHHALGRNVATTTRAAAEALGRIGDAESIPNLLTAAERLPWQQEANAHRTLEHSLAFALIEAGDAPAIRAELARVLPVSRQQTVRTTTGDANDTAASLWKVALIALDQLPAGGLKPDEVLPLLSSAQPALKQVAEWIIGHRPEWSRELSGHFQAQLGDRSLSVIQSEELKTRLARLATDATMQEFLANQLGDATLSSRSRSVVLGAMSQASIKEPPASWEPALKWCFTSGEEATLRAAVATVRTLPVAKKAPMDFTEALLAVARNESLPSDLRVDALAAITGGLRETGDDVFAFLANRLAPEQPPLLRQAAAGVLARARLTDGQLASLTAFLHDAGPMELATLLEAFARTNNEMVGKKLVGLLGGAKNFGSLRPDMINTCLARYPAPVQTAGEELAKRLDAEAATQKTRLHELAASLPAGDIRRGQSIFLSERAACSTCHAIGYQGGNLGPDLTRLGKVRTEADFLESIVFPSRTFVRSYEPVLILARDGETYTGIIKNETSDSVQIVSGPKVEQRIPRANIAEMRPGQLSIMPAGLDQQLSKQELADLVAFLKSQQ